MSMIASMALFALSAQVHAMTKKAPRAPDSESEISLSQTPTGMVWVEKSDQAKSCAKERGIEPDAMAGELTKANIAVSQKRKIHDHQMRIQMCGADKGDKNGFLIARKDLDKAKELGFAPLLNEAEEDSAPSVKSQSKPSPSTAESKKNPQ